MLFSGHLVLPAEPGTVRVARGWLRTDGAIIKELGEDERAPGEPDIGGDGWVISPGFVDTHLHIPQFNSIGADGLPLLRWLEKVIFPAEARWEDADYAGQMAGRIAKTLLAAGTTAIAAYGTVHHGATRAAMRALADAGLAGCFGQVLMDRPPQAPPELCRPTGQLLKEAAAAVGVGRMVPAITPRFAVCCTAELLAGCGELAAKTPWPVQTHLSETTEECAEVTRLFGGMGYVEVYRRSGMLTPRTIFGHGIWLDGGERAALAMGGCVVAHCPTANLFLQAGLMDLAAHLQAGVRVSLGSDVAGGPDVCMVRVARAMIETVKQHRLRGLTDRRFPSAAGAWWQITEGNAAAIGLRGHGSLRVDAPADLVVLRPESTAWTASVDPMSALLYGYDERWIRHTVVHGRVAYEA